VRTGALLAAALAITTCITLSAQPAAAKVPEGLRDIARAYPAPDAQMTVSRPLWDYLASLSRRHASTFVAPTQAESNALLALAKKDGKLDASEIDMLEELSSDVTRSMSIICSDDPSLRVSLGPFTVFINTFNPELDALWLSVWNLGEEGWPTLAEAYGREDLPRLRERITRVASAQVGKVAGQSSMSNRYQPLRDLLGERYGWNNAVAAEHQRGGRLLLFRATERVDRTNGDTMPNFLYDWTKPSDYLVG